MIILNYETKKELKAAIGQRLKYRETSIFGSEYTENGVIYGSNRPHITGYKREFYAAITLKNGLIEKVN